MVLEFEDEAVPGTTHTLAATQGVSGEAVEDKDQGIVCGMSTSFLLLVASSSILTWILWSGANDGSSVAVT
jgi:hypothetical protein